MGSLDTPSKYNGLTLLSKKILKNLLISVLLLCFSIGLNFLSGCHYIQGIKTASEIAEAYVKREATIIVYLKDNISDDLKENIENEIKSWEEVKEIKYISKEEAFERFKKQHEGDKVLNEIQGNLLPASFEIKLKSNKEVEQTISKFMDKDGNYIDGVDEIIYSEF
jgi:cell division transport system permease protein